MRPPRSSSTGGQFGIYPEGTRTRDGLLHRGHTGVARLALRTGAPLVPVGLVGTDEIQPTDSKMPRFFRTVTVRFGHPIDLTHYEGRADDHLALRQLTDEVMYEIHALSGYEYVDTYATKGATGGATRSTRHPRSSTCRSGSRRSRADLARAVGQAQSRDRSTAATNRRDASRSRRRPSTG